MRIISFVAMLSIFFTACLSDIRTPFMKESIEVSNASKGKTLLEEAAKKAGLDAFKSKQTYTVDFEEELHGSMIKLVKPYKENKISLKLDYIPNTFTGRLTIQSGKQKGDVWGIQSWHTYSLDASGNPVFKNNKNTKFWVPTYQYFIEFPFRILSADVITYAGEKKHDGKMYDLVFASWKSEQPQKDVDQYLIWIEKATGLIEILQYTVRDQLGGIVGFAFCSNFKNFEGITVPGELNVKSSLDSKKLMHTMRIKNISFDQISKADLLPNQSIELKEDSK